MREARSLDDVRVLVDRQALCGEGPLWDAAAGVLRWVDIVRRELHAYDPVTGQDRLVVLPVPVGAVALTGGPELVAAAGLGFALVDPESGTLGHLAEGSAGDRMNDGACDPAGRFLAGTLTFAREPGASALYRLDTGSDHAATAVPLVEGMTLSNGIGWSPEGSTMYLIDTGERTVFAHPYDPGTGALGERRVFAVAGEGEGNPDGLAVDAEGCVWVAMHWSGRLHRYDPAGTLLEVFQAPTSRVTSLAFGGADLRDVYVTSACFSYGEQQLVADPHAGALFTFRSDTPGLPTTPWHGFAGDAR